MNGETDSHPSGAAQKFHEVPRVAKASRTERLLLVTGAIAEAVAADEVFEAVVDAAGRAVGALGGALFLVEDVQLVMVRSFGYAEATRKKLAAVPLDGALRFPWLDSIRDGRPRWFSSRQELVDEYPHLVADRTEVGVQQIACLPVRVAGRTAGSLVFCFDRATAIDDEERAFLLLVARYGAQALERLRLLEAERQTRARAERSAARKAILYRMAQSVIEAAGVEDVFEAALDAIEAALGVDRSAILVFDDDDVMRFKKWRGLSDAYRQAVEGHSPWGRDARNPQPIVVADAGTDESMASYQALFVREAIAALGFIPLVAGGQLVGKFMVYYRQPIELDKADLDIAKAIANQVAAAIARFESRRQLEETLRLHEMFVGVLGHDLRNPLMAIVMAAQLCLRRAEEAKLREPLGRIVASSDRMTRMIAQLLDFTRVRAGSGFTLARQEIDLASLLRQVVDEISDAHPACRLALDAGGGARGVWDPDRLYQVFSNLVANAARHGRPGGGVRVRVHTTAAVARVEVHNEGVVPRELLPHVFEPMVGHKQKSQGCEGLGLGLFITDQIVRAHGGFVEVRSGEAEGTTFTVSLPRFSATSGSIGRAG